MRNINLQKRSERGIAIYMAVTVTAALVLVSFAVVNLVLKQIGISAAARDSEAAFYAADSGIECALFWDLKNPTYPGVSAFATTSSVQDVSCGGGSITPTRVIGGSGNGTSTFSFTFSPDTYCVTVMVGKSYSAGSPKTRMESRGYNSCDSSNTRRVERAVLVNY